MADLYLEVIEVEEDDEEDEEEDEEDVENENDEQIQVQVHGETHVLNPTVQQRSTISSSVGGIVKRESSSQLTGKLKSSAKVSKKLGKSTLKTLNKSKSSTETVEVSRTMSSTSTSVNYESHMSVEKKSGGKLTSIKGKTKKFKKRI